MPVEFLDRRQDVFREGENAFMRGSVTCPYPAGWERDAWWKGWEAVYYKAPTVIRNQMWEKRYQAGGMA